MAVPPGAVAAFCDLLGTSDRRAAARYVTGLADAGTSTEELILGLFAPVEEEIGARWERREWDVAQEHAATSIVESLLAVVGFGDDMAPTAGRLLVACAEGEWHSLPARMAAEVLRRRGWDVTFLGPSVPADDLAAHARRLAPDAVGVSCSVPLYLKGALRSIEACRSAGVPVVAGGAGFGDEGHYALRLGAVVWVSDPASFAPAPWPSPGGGGGGAWPKPAAAVLDPAGDVASDHVVLEAVRPALVSRVEEALLAGGDVRPPGNGAEGGAAVVVGVREAVETLVLSVENACLVGDDAVVTRCMPVVERLLPDEVASEAFVRGLLELLLPELGRHSRAAARLVGDALGDRGGA